MYLRFLIVIFLFFGCQRAFQGQTWERRAPTREQDLGYIVTGVDQNNLQSWLEDKHYRARVLSEEKQIFEIYAPEKEIAELRASSIARNKFFSVNQVADQGPPAVISVADVERLKGLYSPAIGLANLPQEHSRGHGVVVAILDTGIDFPHPDLQHAEWKNPNEIPDNNIDDDSNGLIDDVNGWNFAIDNNQTQDQLLRPHGTMVAGVIAGAVTGIATDAKLMSLRVTSGGVGDWGTIIKALDYAEKTGASVINMSLSGQSIDEELRTAFQVALGSTMIFVSSAGNSGLSCDDVKFFPGGYGFANGISVIATNVGELAHERMPYTNFGSCYDIAAPGGLAPASGIVTTIGQRPELYRLFDGTSAATPLVTATVALLRETHPELSPPQIKQILVDSAEQVPGLFEAVPGGHFLRIDQALQNTH